MARLIEWAVGNAGLLIALGVVTHISSSFLVHYYVRKEHPKFDQIANPELKRFIWRTSGETGRTPNWVLLLTNLAMLLYVVGGLGLVVRLVR